MERFLTVFTKTSKIYKQIYRIILLAEIKVHVCWLWRGGRTPLRVTAFGSVVNKEWAGRPGKEVAFQNRLGPLFPAPPARNSFNLLGGEQMLGEGPSCRQSKRMGFHPFVTRQTMIKRPVRRTLYIHEASWSGPRDRVGTDPDLQIFRHLYVATNRPPAYLVFQ